MSEATVILLALVAALPPTLTSVAQWRQQNRLLREQKQELEQVHRIVNSQRTEMQAMIDVLKAEVERLNELLK